MPLAIPAPPEGYVLNAAPSSAPDVPPPPEGYFLNTPAQPIGTTEDVFRSGGSGILKGAAGLVGAPGDALDTLNSGLNRLNDWLGPKIGYSPEEIEKTKVKPGAVTNTGELVGALDRAGAIHTPETTLGKYAESVGEFARHGDDVMLRRAQFGLCLSEGLGEAFDPGAQRSR